MATKETKRRKISKYAFTTLNSFSAIILLAFVYFLNTKGVVDKEALTKVSVGSMGIVSGICIVIILHYLKEKTTKQKTHKEAVKVQHAKLQLAANMRLEHDQEIDQIIAKLQEQKYRK